MSVNTISRGLSAAIILSLSSVLPAFAGDISISNAYARGSGAKTGTGAAFMEITNSGSQDDQLIAASTESAAKAELHTHIHGENGVMMMRKDEDGFEVPAGGTAVLKRGGDHVMMMGIPDKLEQGQIITLILTFEKAGEVALDVTVDQDR